MGKMKSAFELALERTGGKLNVVPEDTRKALAAIDVKYNAKIAELELSANDRLARESDPEKIQAIKDSLLTDTASMRDKAEREKNAVRSGD